MKSNLALSCIALLGARYAPTAIDGAALSGAAISAAVAVSGAFSAEEVAPYGLTLEEFAGVRASESPADFGGLPSAGDADRLWLDATVFEYEVATSHASDHVAVSPDYYPYLVCSSHPGMSGLQREDEINRILEGTPGVKASDYYTGGNMFHNDDSRSCGVLRAYNNTVARLYEGNPDDADYLSVNPMHPSMKMMANTVETLRGWFEMDLTGDDLSVSGSGGGEDADLGRMEVKQPGLKMLLCPGVLDFEPEDVPEKIIAEIARSFVTGGGGETVKELSFYYHRVNNVDGDGGVHTGRMNEWSTAISRVANMTRVDGSNPCLDEIIGENMLFTIMDVNLEVKANLSTWEMLKTRESLGLSKGDHEACIWYLTYGLALNPMICTMEPSTKVRTLCKDGTSELGKCPAELPEVGDGGDASSSGRIGSGPWRNGVASTAALVSLLGFAIS